MKAHAQFRVAILALFSVSVAACSTMPDAPIVANGPAAPAGTAVGLGNPVWAGQIVATPMEVREDSRCPMNARCIRAGEVIVLTRIDGAGWRETAPLTLGEAYATHGTTILLTSVTPHQMAGNPISSADYLFTFEGGD